VLEWCSGSVILLLWWYSMASFGICPNDGLLCHADGRCPAAEIDVFNRSGFQSRLGLMSFALPWWRAGRRMHRRAHQRVSSSWLLRLLQLWRCTCGKALQHPTSQVRGERAVDRGPRSAEGSGMKESPVWCWQPLLQGLIAGCGRLSDERPGD